MNDIIEIVYTGLNGKESVHYRRPKGSKEAIDLIKEINNLRKQQGDECPYSYREVSS